MNKEFCINCGHKNLFEVSKPKFCAGCGSPFNTSSNQSIASEENENEISELKQFDINKLKSSIVFESRSSIKTLDDLWKDPAPRDNNTFRSPSSDPSGNEIIKRTMSECSPVKQAKEIGDE